VRIVIVFRKSIAYVILCIFVGTCIGPCVAQNTTALESQMTRNSILYVGGSGPGNYSTIQDAINASTDGDTVFVYQGTYNEQLTIPTSITLMGENRTATVVDGNQKSDVITVNADQITLRNLSVRNSANNHAGILLLSDYNTISNMNLLANEYAIYGISSSDNTIDSNILKANQFGVRLTNASHHNIIRNNTIISWLFDFDIYIVEASNDNLISGNNLSNEDGTGLYVFDSQGTVITDNTVTVCKYGINMYQANNTVITDNRIGPNKEDGLSLAKSSGVVISGNIFDHDGLFIYDAFGNTITENKVNGKPLVYHEGVTHETIDPGAGQIILINCSDITIQHQDIHDTNNGIEIWGGSDFHVIDNELINNKRNLYLTRVSSATVTGNTLTSNQSHIFMNTLNIEAGQDITVSKNTFSTTDPYTYLFIGGTRLTFSDNSLDGTHIHVLVGSATRSVIEKNTFSSGEGIGLYNCSNNKLRDNVLILGCIEIEYSRNNEISGNTVKNNSDGYALYVRHSYLNKITRNTFQNCNGGVSLSDAQFNRITRNNFIDCGSSPGWFSNAFLNRWLRNYWGAVHPGPMIIHGEYVIIHDWPVPPTVIPMVDWDLFPRQAPLL
jgi:parallel beta-helix repeat protein